MTCQRSDLLACWRVRVLGVPDVGSGAGGGWLEFLVGHAGGEGFLEGGDFEGEVGFVRAEGGCDLEPGEGLNRVFGKSAQGIRVSGLLLI